LLAPRIIMSWSPRKAAGEETSEVQIEILVFFLEALDQYKENFVSNENHRDILASCFL